MTNLIPAASRGHANHGWLDTHHSFSFANYHNPGRMGFGALRVLNDDVVAGGRGFGRHPHRDMEIVSLPLAGVLEHRDSMGTRSLIKTGDIQVMSAGTGVEHSEKNGSLHEEVRFLQIWVIPRETRVEPRYQQLAIDTIPIAENGLRQLVSPSQDDPGVWVHQDAWFTLAELKPSVEVSYGLHDERHGVYAFVLEGEATVAGASAGGRDAVEVTDVTQLSLRAKESARVLLIEVPLFG